MSAALAGTSPELEAVAVPTLVIHGALDALAPVADAHELANTIPGAQLVVIDDAGHVPPLTRPDAVASAINSWWTQTARPPLASEDAEDDRATVPGHDRTA